MNIEIPENVAKIINILEKAGYEAYAVGGCVRDTILGRKPEDWDITTSAKPLEIKALFRRTVDTGIQHGTVTVLLGGSAYEVTTYRVDGEYEDGRHPKQVEFTASLVEDLKRRDFTINAMAYNPGTGLVDEFDGIGDLDRRIIRCVGDAHERFSEDALRMLRAVRFSGQLGFEIDGATFNAIKVLAGNLRLISAERIHTELNKLLISPHPDYLRIAYETGITAVVLPEFDRMMATPQKNIYHNLNVGEHTLKMLSEIRADVILRWTALFHDIGKPDTMSEDADGIIHFRGHAELGSRIAHDVMKRLKFDNDTLNKVVKLVANHELRFEITPRSVRRLVNRVGDDMFLPLLEVCLADNMAKTEYAVNQYRPIIAKAREYYEEIKSKEQCTSLATLELKGRDLIDAGMKPGREIGEALDKCLELVLDNPEANTKARLLEYLGLN